MKIKLKTTYWTETRSPEEYKAQIERHIFIFMWILAGNVVTGIFTNNVLLTIINTIIFLMYLIIEITYMKYKKDRSELK